MLKIQSNYQRTRYNSRPSSSYSNNGRVEKKESKPDDLVIEENTVYEIDMECYNNAKKGKMDPRGNI